jgi:hypothetical protein
MEKLSLEVGEEINCWHWNDNYARIKRTEYGYELYADGGDFGSYAAGLYLGIFDTIEEADKKYNGK